MIWQEFLRRFKPKVITILKVFGPMLLYQVIGVVLEYLRFPPLGTIEVLMAAAATFLVVALVCWLWAFGEWSWFSLRRLRFFGRELRRFSQDTGSQVQREPRSRPVV